MLLLNENPKDKNITQKFLRAQIEHLAKKPIQPTDKIVCYQLSPNPFEKAYLINKKYEKRFNRLEQLFQKSDEIQKLFVSIMIMATLSIATTTSDYKETSSTYSLERNVNNESQEKEEKTQESKEEINITEAANLLVTLKNELEQVKNEQYWAQNFKSIRVEELENSMLYDSFIREYCEYFNLDAEKVIEFARNLTNGYTINFQNFFPIKYQMLNNPDVSSMRFVYYLDREKLINTGDNKYSLEDFKLPEKITTIPHDNLETLVLNNGERFTENLGKICDYFEYDDKVLALTFVYAETGQKGSPASRNKNNPFGIMDGDEPETFATFEEAVIRHVGNLKNNYPLSKYNAFDNFQSLSNKYNKAPTEEQRETWRNNMKNAYNDISLRYDQLFSESQLEEGTILHLSLEK